MCKSYSIEKVSKYLYEIHTWRTMFNDDGIPTKHENKLAVQKRGYRRCMLLNQHLEYQSVSLNVVKHSSLTAFNKCQVQ